MIGYDEEMVETAAMRVYEAMCFAAAAVVPGVVADTATPQWVERGNSHAQHEARKQARAILGAAMTPTPSEPRGALAPRPGTAEAVAFEPFPVEYTKLKAALDVLGNDALTSPDAIMGAVSVMHEFTRRALLTITGDAVLVPTATFDAMRGAVEQIIADAPAAEPERETDTGNPDDAYNSGYASATHHIAQRLRAALETP